MKKQFSHLILLISLLVLLPSMAYSLEGDLQWVKGLGTGVNNRGDLVKILPDNTFIVAGLFFDKVVFDLGKITETQLSATGNNGDIFIAKYNSTGTLVWAKSTSGIDRDVPSAITLLPDDSFLLAGRFKSSTLTLGAGETNETQLVSGNSKWSAFFAKYNADGTLAWAKTISSDAVFCSGISAIADGSFSISGNYTGTAIFGSGEPNQTQLTSVGSNDIFVARYNADGTLVWVKSVGGSGNDAGYDIAALTDGSFVITGYYYDTVIFGNGEPNQTQFTSEGYADVFVAKYNVDGTLAWAKTGGGVFSDYGSSISLFADNSFFITGYLSSYTAIFGAGEPNQTEIGSNGAHDPFIIKYNADGTLAWAKTAGGTSVSDYAIGSSPLLDGTCLTTGYFTSSTLLFGQGEVNETSLSHVGKYDIFLAKYNTDGTLAWAKSAGGINNIYSFRVSAFDDGTSVITGSFSGTVVFGSGEANQTQLISLGDYDLFIARYNADGTLAWAKSTGSPVFGNLGNSIASYEDDSYIFVGSYRKVLSIGSGDPNFIKLFCAGASDIFVAKYNADHTLAWAKGVGSADVDEAESVTSLADGSCLVTGKFSGTVTFGTGEANETQLISSGGTDIFVAKYNSDGTLVWAKKAGGTGEEEGECIAGANDNSSIIVGKFGGTVIFGSGEAAETQLISQGALDIFAAKYNADGTLAWAKSVGSTTNDEGNGVSVLDDGSSIVTGYFSGTVTFGFGEANETQLVSSGGTDMFLARYNANGTLAWAKSVGSTGNEAGRSISKLSVTETCYITGFFSDMTIFGSGEANETQLVSAGGLDVFVAKYNLDGTLIWAKSAGSAGDDCGDCLWPQNDGISTITGYFSGTATFGNGEANQTQLISAGDKDIFVAKYNLNGTLAWAKRAGGITEDAGLALAKLSDGSVLAGGYFSDTTTFGPGETNQTDLTSNGDRNIFLAKFESAPTPVELVYFTATQKENNVVLEWETASEVDNAGFYLWRSSNRTSGYTRITESIIPAEGGVTWGAKYTYTDLQVNSEKQYYYKLQDIDNKGKSSFYGPCHVK